MIESIRSSVDIIFDAVVANTIPAALTVLAVLVLQFAFRKRFSPRWRYFWQWWLSREASFPHAAPRRSILSWLCVTSRFSTGKR